MLIARKATVGDGQRMLDMGSGWGSLFDHVVERRDVRATGVTLWVTTAG